eukprot:3953629-Alexandrium_andersonii.AAC.1
MRDARAARRAAGEREATRATRTRIRGKRSVGPDCAPPAAPVGRPGPSLGAHVLLAARTIALPPAVGEMPTPTRKRSLLRLADGAHAGAVVTRPLEDGAADDAPKRRRIVAKSPSAHGSRGAVALGAGDL